MKPFVISLLVILGIYGVLAWTNSQDEKRIEAYQKYEECVEREYRTTPAQWYAEHGELPVCE